ncbi:hypothetical protein [Kluyvera genomosp. 1]|uniref:hypothetical protein n=1 Tax=Kluyvera genomosp. 1 TaxID=2774053 RepID=UPI000A5F00DE|nr:hypothetical protein [Kluyvera genomosp. 1]
MILFYSKSFVNINAFNNLAHDLNLSNVFAFTDRVRFLTCATLIRDATYIIDTVSAIPGDVNWINQYLSTRVKPERIHYIAHPAILKNSYSSYVNTITTLVELRKKLVKIQKEKYSLPNRPLSQHVKENVRRRLGAGYYNVVLHEQSTPEERDRYISTHGQRAYLNRRYQISRKLNLRTLQEYRSMIMLMNAD